MGASGQVTTPTEKLRDAVRDRGWSEEELAWVLDLPVDRLFVSRGLLEQGRLIEGGVQAWVLFLALLD